MADVLHFPPPAQSAPSPHGNAPPSDAAERSQALDITRSWIIEAPAGSGKTGLLIQRFLKLLGSPQVTDPAEILAITFTRKATGELRDRVFQQLAAAAAGTPEPNSPFDHETRLLAQAALLRDRDLGWNLLQQPHRLNIRTIDSLCAEIARSLPVLAGSGGQRPTEDGSALHRDAARRTLMLLGGPDPALSESLRTVLLHRDGSLANCEALLAGMLAWRDQWGDLVPLGRHQLDDAFLDEKVLPRLNRALELAICRGLTRLTQVLPRDVLEQLCHFAAELAHAEGYNGNPSPLAMCAGKHLPPPEQAAHLEHWRALVDLLLTKGGEFRSPRGLSVNNVMFRLDKREKAELARIIDRLRGNVPVQDALCSVRSLPPAQYPAEQWPIVKALFRVLSRALVELQLVFAERGECDFTEPALQARFALQADDALLDLRASVGFGLRHLLIDEMQDTSSGQYQLVELLTRGWGGEGETLFLVGDPKQSIYAFRQARVERFVETMHLGRLGGVELGTIRLSANFRSQRSLVGGFNVLFSQLFPPTSDPTRPELVPFHEASATRAQTLAAAELWHPAVLPYQPDKALCQAERRDAQRTQAAEIKRLAAEWMRRPLPPERAAKAKPWTIGVLVRNRNHLLEIVQAFKAEPAVPFRAIDIEPLGERQEILDLVSLTRALVHPADRTAWLSLLRSPWCGLTLADLHTLAGADDASLRRVPVPELIATRGDLLSPDAIARLEAFWIVVDAALAQRTEMPLARVVELTWRSFGTPAHISGEELANSVQFFRLLETLESPIGSIDLDLLATGLNRLYAAPAVHPAGLPVADFVTIHKSKGLEWDVVLVPALEGAVQTDATRLLSWLETDGRLETDRGSALDEASAAHGIVAPIAPRGGDTHALNRWMREVEARRAEAERIRLLYVVCTRAREQLHLFGTASEGKEGKLSPGTGSLLRAAWPAVQERFEQTLAGMKAAAAPHVALGAANTRVPQVSTLRPGISATPQNPAAPLSLAAASDTAALHPAAHPLERIPIENMHLARHAASAAAPQAPFTRPEGSFPARAFGNTVHDFLDRLAHRIAVGESPESLRAEIPAWTARIAAVLRSAGLGPAPVDRLTGDTLRALTRTLDSPAGRWILAPHPNAASERALTSSTGDGRLTGLRLDRTFLAGPAPGSTGDTHLWIVDYKTGTHGQNDLANFLEAEKQKYRGQLETYAQTLAAQAEARPLHLALFYPLLGELVWWPFDPAADNGPFA